MESLRAWSQYLFLASQFHAAAEVLSGSKDRKRTLYAHLALNRHALELLLKALIVRDRELESQADAEAVLKGEFSHGFAKLAAALKDNRFLNANEHYKELLNIAGHFADTPQGLGFRYPYPSVAVETFNPTHITGGIGIAVHGLEREFHEAARIAGLSVEQASDMIGIRPSDATG